MAGINRVILVGNLAKDPELRHTAGGTAVCELRVAVNSREKDGSGEWVDRADFFDVTVWEAQAEACAQYLSKGSAVGVDGRLREDRWEDKETGAKRSKVKVVATGVQFLGARDNDAGQAAHEQPQAVPAGADFG